MKVQCVLCDDILELENDSFTAKRLRNQQGKMYICPACDQRIKDKTAQRVASGNFKLYRKKKSERDTLIQ